MQHGESDVEHQVSKQCIHLSASWNYSGKREGSFKRISEINNNKVKTRIYS